MGFENRKTNINVLSSSFTNRLSYFKVFDFTMCHFSFLGIIEKIKRDDNTYMSHTMCKALCSHSDVLSYLILIT